MAQQFHLQVDLRKHRKQGLRYLHTLLPVAKRWQQTECPLVGGWMNQMWSTHTVEYYSALRRKNILMPATWMDLEDTVQPATHKRINTGGFHLCEVPSHQITETDSRVVGTRAGRRDGESMFHGDRVSVLQDE